MRWLAAAVLPLGNRSVCLVFRQQLIGTVAPLAIVATAKKRRVRRKSVVQEEEQQIRWLGACFRVEHFCRVARCL